MHNILTDPSLMGLIKALEVLVLFIITLICSKLITLLNMWVFRFTLFAVDHRHKKTLEALVKNTYKYIIFTIFILMSLKIVGIDIKATLTGLGVVGVALGLGAQSLIKDIVSGIFILFEDQYGVGDSVQLNTFFGRVIMMGLRVTQLRAWSGEIYTIQHGNVTSIINYSKSPIIMPVDVGIAYSVNIQDALDVLGNVLEQIKIEHDGILSTSVMGVVQLGASAITIRGTLECGPDRQWGAQRLAYQRIVEAFNKEGIEIPFTQIDIHLPKGDVQK